MTGESSETRAVEPSSDSSGVDPAEPGASAAEPAPAVPGPGPADSTVLRPAEPAVAFAPFAVSRRNPMLRPLPIALLVVGILVACGVPVGLWLSSDSMDLVGARSVGAPIGSPSPKPVSPEEYQRALAASDAAMAAAFQQMSAALSAADVMLSAAAGATVISSEGNRFLALTPPPAANVGHRQLIDGLARLKYEFESMDADRADGRPCTGVAAVQILANSAPATILRRATETLKVADPAHPYNVGAFLPAAAALPARRLTNGTLVSGAGRGGSGQLKVVNSSATDVAVTLTTVGTLNPAFTVYVHTNASFTVSGVRDGNYDTYLTSGTDWDNGSRRFTRGCDFSKFDEPSKFTTTRTTYSVWTITLGGTAATGSGASDVDPKSFPTL